MQGREKKRSRRGKTETLTMKRRARKWKKRKGLNETERNVAKKKKVTIRDENKKENEGDRQMKKKEFGEWREGELFTKKIK